MFETVAVWMMSEMKRKEMKPHLAVVTRIACTHNTMAIPMVGVCFHLRVHSIIVVLLLLLLLLYLHLLWMSVGGIDSCIVITRDDANLLIRLL
jgi:hypothetical protein